MLHEHLEKKEKEKKRMAEHFIKVYFRWVHFAIQASFRDSYFSVFLFERRREVCLGNKAKGIVSCHMSPIHI